MTVAERHPWERSYPEGCRWDAPIEIGPLPTLLDRAAAQWADKSAIEYHGRRISFRELAALVDRLASGLLAAGIGPGSTVALHLPNTPWHPVCFFALARAGARIVHLSALDARRELAHKLRDSGARQVITTDFPALLDSAGWLLEQEVAQEVFVARDSFWHDAETPACPAPLRPLEALLDAAPPAIWPERKPDDVLLLQYTGGTTGLPKGAMLTHGNLTASVSIYRSWRDRTALTPGEQRVMLVLPLFHIYALTAVFLRHIADGNELLLRPRFDAASALDDIEKRRVTVFPGVPTMWIALLNQPGLEKRDLSSLRSTTSGGAPLPFEVQQRLQAVTGRQLGGGWGMTETGPAGTRVTPDAPQRPGMIGLPLPGIEIRIVSLDDPTQVLPAGETGEIAIRGPNVFKGYWNKPEATDAAFRDGFFLTGDIGRMDEGGFITLVDRRKNMIISGGFNVYPAAIEQAIYEHPDVAECIVIGIPDAYRGEAAKAFVTLRQGAPGLTLDALLAFLRDRVGRHEMPAALEIRETLPRSPTGKLLASALREEARAAATSADSLP
ncbi:long-chain fatty acid--CoA ligase [Roseomonas xinghualingensis]|uniref:long-chain fatty acid--CoA ligase n=1 Tax=Roseomonas xinghualingensis TaxID=2986475 RepID=UPI0021F174FC|nr:long-chain fatty acid--CoA ligase [Roseomonas sp. SXEYE001]MCV4209712.1 long-chain fatty acid--CoA ligase [Roseomonas sp. SXEYE001]